MKFCKRPVVVEAHRWFKNGDHPDDYKNYVEGLQDGEARSLAAEYARGHGLEGKVVRRFRHPVIEGASPCPLCGQPHDDHGWVETLEGGHRVCPGDWIITGVQGEHYPCKSDIFAKTYVIVDEE